MLKQPPCKGRFFSEVVKLVKVDVSGLETLTNALANLKDNIPDINAAFMHDEFREFKEKVVPITPVDTGHMQSSYFSTPIRQDGSKTEQEWYNNAGEHDVEKGWLNPHTGKMEHGYSSFVNYGTIKMAPRYFWEKGMAQAEEGRQGRYNDAIAAKLDSEIGIKAGIEIEYKDFPEWQKQR